MIKINSLRITKLKAFCCSTNKASLRMASFVLLLILYLSAKIVDFLSKKLNRVFNRQDRSNKISKKVSIIYEKLVERLDIHDKNAISRIDLIELSINNLKAKKIRTVITIGGMAIGIGLVVFLVSIGYGLQNLVISRVTRLEEMSQVNVYSQAGGKIKLNDKVLANFNDLSGVSSALPVIAAAGKINYQNSITDVAVYGVTADYLRQSAIKPVKGDIFKSNSLVSDISQTGKIAGVYTEERLGEINEEIDEVNFLIDSGSWLRVRSGPSTDNKIIGYTKRVEGHSKGIEVWGDEYQSDDDAGSYGVDSEGEVLGKWLKVKVLLWQKQICDPETDGECEDGKYRPSRDQDGLQIQEEGYVGEVNLTVDDSFMISQVLGVTNEIDGDDEDIDWVKIASEAGVVQKTKLRQIKLASGAQREAVVNQALLEVLSLNEGSAVGQSFSVSFVIVGELLENQEDKIESISSEYTIIGVVPEGKNPLFYVPFIDLRGLGVENYSQVKVSTETQKGLNSVRKQIEAMGYVTQSVVDTISQINSLFATAIAIFALFGMIALVIAALGMFNTLTISLLERTREVGLMKAMGMKSKEVKELFLTESIIMGFYGGILGLIIGIGVGGIVSLILSVFSVVRGAGMINITHVPFYFILLIFVLSLGVGIVTGIYPAKRATKISALDALRYE